MVTETQAPEPTPEPTANPAPTVEPVAPGAACADAMSIAADEPDVERANPLIIDTLSACSTAAEWLGGLEAHPGALGLTEDAEITAISLQSACFGNEATPVCADAAALGLL